MGRHGVSASTRVRRRSPPTFSLSLPAPGCKSCLSARAELRRGAQTQECQEGVR